MCDSRRASDAGALVKEVCKDAVEAALHKQGTYALQKVLESPCRDSEFVQLGKSLMERGLELVSGEPGIYVMSKLVEQLVRIMNRSSQFHMLALPYPADGVVLQAKHARWLLQGASE